MNPDAMAYATPTTTGATPARCRNGIAPSAATAAAIEPHINAASVVSSICSTVSPPPAAAGADHPRAGDDSVRA
jgi:hypothetical protein